MSISAPYHIALRILTVLGCALLSGHAAVSSALSPPITVDTRDTSELIPLKTRLTAKKSNKSHTLVRRHSPTVGLTRNPEQPVYLALDVPRFASKGGGWAPRTKGLGVFHGFEVIYNGDQNDRIYQKIGGAPPSSSTPDREWKSISANRIINENISPETRYFKVVFADGGQDAAQLSVRFHSTRLTDADGSPITKLNSKANIWLVFHDKDSGGQTLSALHDSLQKARSRDQIVTVDWASAATTRSGWQQPAANADYFRNIGSNLAQLLKQQGFSRRQVNLIGHGWGAVVAHETAARFGSCNHIIALNPTVRGAGAFNARSIRFSRVSKIATSIKSGNRKQGSIGNESMANTADFSIRMLSQSHKGDKDNASFHQALPVDWCVQSLSSHKGPYWPHLKNSILLRNKTQPKLPWSVSGKLTGGFDLECLGRTRHDKNGSTPEQAATINRLTSLAFLRNNKRTVARATLSQNGEIIWKYRRK